MGRNQIRTLYSGAVVGLIAIATLVNPGTVTLAADVDATTVGPTIDVVQSAAGAMPAEAQFAPAGCSAITQCPVARTVEGWEMYSGGNYIRLERFAEDE